MTKIYIVIQYQVCMTKIYIVIQYQIMYDKNIHSNTGSNYLVTYNNVQVPFELTSLNVDYLYLLLLVYMYIQKCIVYTFNLL